MIALLLAAQLAAAAPPAQPPAITPSAKGDFVLHLRRPNAASCMSGIGRTEVSLLEPAALYRQGDRPGKSLRKWADYPDGSFCRVEAAR